MATANENTTEVVQQTAEKSDRSMLRRTVLRKGVVAAGGLTLGATAAGTAVAQPDKQKGGSGVLAHTAGSAPSFEKFKVLIEAESGTYEFEYERGCGRGGKKRSNIHKENRAYEVQLLDVDCNPVGGGSGLWVQPSHKDIGDSGDVFKVNNLCETESTYADVSGFTNAVTYWITFSPSTCP